MHLSGLDAPEYRRSMIPDLPSLLYTEFSTYPRETCVLTGTSQTYNWARLDTVDWFAAEEDPSPRVTHQPIDWFAASEQEDHPVLRTPSTPVSYAPLNWFPDVPEPVTQVDVTTHEPVSKPSFALVEELRRVISLYKRIHSPAVKEPRSPEGSHNGANGVLFRWFPGEPAIPPPPAFPPPPLSGQPDCPYHSRGGCRPSSHQGLSYHFGYEPTAQIEEPALGVAPRQPYPMQVILVVPVLRVSAWLGTYVEVVRCFAVALATVLSSVLSLMGSHQDIYFVSLGLALAHKGPYACNIPVDPRSTIALFDLLVRSWHALSVEVHYFAFGRSPCFIRSCRASLPVGQFHTRWLTHVNGTYAILVDWHQRELIVMYQCFRGQQALRGGWSHAAMAEFRRVEPLLEAMRERDDELARIGLPPPPPPLFTVPYPRDPEWRQPHADATELARRILTHVAGRALISSREINGLGYFDAGDFFPTTHTAVWLIPQDVRVREILLYTLGRGARRFRLSLLQFNMRRRVIQRGIVTYTTDFSTGWMAQASGAFAIILAPSFDDALVLYNERAWFLPLRGGTYHRYHVHFFSPQGGTMACPSLGDSCRPPICECRLCSTYAVSCTCVTQVPAANPCLSERMDPTLGGKIPVWSHAQLADWTRLHASVLCCMLLCSLAALCHSCALIIACVVDHCVVDHVGPDAAPGGARGGMIELEVDFDNEEAGNLMPDVDAQPPKAEIVDEDRSTSAAEHIVQSSPAEGIINDALPQQPDPPQQIVQTKDETALQSMQPLPPPSKGAEDNYDPETRARVLSGRLHLGMELEDCNTLPRGQVTKDYTITWGERIGTTRKRAELLWKELSPFSTIAGLLWHGSWHLDFLPGAQAPVEEYNLAVAVWKQGYDWGKIVAAIKHCRQEFRQLTELLHDPWMELRQQVAKNKNAQRKAWDVLLKASFLPTREEYERKEAKRLQMLKQTAEEKAKANHPDDAAAKPTHRESSSSAAQAEASSSAAPHQLSCNLKRR
eukprot:697142-Amphidinium_carterae.1